MDDDTQSESTTEMTAVMLAMQKAASSRVKGGKKSDQNTKQAQLQALQSMMESMFGGSIPTLRKIIGNELLPSVLVTDSVRHAVEKMSAVRKGVLVMDSLKTGKLVGILTPKDVLVRVVAKEKSPDVVSVGDVMTANPDSVSADLTLLDALREMHDHKFLHLPVRDGEESDGLVVGLVDVMQLVGNSAGE